jgi:ribonuclease BN (tRNA processing enzyme)/DNA-binding NarL/FixJ family response regulator
MKQVFIASANDLYLKELIAFFKKRKNFVVTVVHDGEECDHLVSKHSPDYLFLDLILPKTHGMYILKKIRALGLTTKVFIYTAKSVEQDYIESLELGAQYYMLKPFPLDKLDELLLASESETLHPISYREALALSQGEKTSPLFSTKHELTTSHTLPKNLTIDAPQTNHYIKFWGTRGSVPVSGYEHLLYGGNTSCLEVRDDKDLIIIDAGTGIRSLSKAIMQDKHIENIHLFISHTHWDHILGFPFFLPSYKKDYEINVYAPKGSRKSIRDIFTGMLAREYFPIALEEMAANIHFHELDPISSIEVGSTTLHFTYANHPGPCICFRLETPNQSFGYATDNEMFGGYLGHPMDIQPGHPLFEAYKPLIDFFSSCDVLIHEAQYTASEYAKRIGWGHSSIANATALAKLCGVKKWYVTHHDPEATDENLMNRLLIHKEVIEECDFELDIHFAHDYMILPL